MEAPLLWTCLSCTLHEGDAQDLNSLKRTHMLSWVLSWSSAQKSAFSAALPPNARSRDLFTWKMMMIIVICLLKSFLKLCGFSLAVTDLIIHQLEQNHKSQNIANFSQWLKLFSHTYRYRYQHCVNGPSSEADCCSHVNMKCNFSSSVLFINRLAAFWQRRFSDLYSK